MPTATKTSNRPERKRGRPRRVSAQRVEEARRWLSENEWRAHARCEPGQGQPDHIRRECFPKSPYDSGDSMARRLLNALERSERRDLLVSEAIQTRKAGRPRKFWALTPLGVEVLKEVPSYVGRHPGVALAERTAADVARKGRGTVRHDLHLTDVTLAVGGKTRYRAS